jgi:excisionase family DNA binding protein
MSRGAVGRALRLGRLPGSRIPGGGWRVDRRELEAWVERQRRSRPPPLKRSATSLAMRWKQRRIAAATKRSDADAAEHGARARGTADTLSVAESARLLEVSRSSVYRALAGGTLSGHKERRSWRVDRRSLDEWAEEQRRRSNPAPSRRRPIGAALAGALAAVGPAAVASGGAVWSPIKRLGSRAATGRRGYAVGTAAAVTVAAIITFLTLSDAGEPNQQRSGSEDSGTRAVHAGSDGGSTAPAEGGSGKPDEGTTLAKSSGKPARSNDPEAAGGGGTGVPAGSPVGAAPDQSPGDSSPTPGGQPPPSDEAAPPPPATPSPSSPPAAPPTVGGAGPATPSGIETGVQPPDGGSGGIETGMGG